MGDLEVDGDVPETLAGGSGVYTENHPTNTAKYHFWDIQEQLHLDLWPILIIVFLSLSQMLWLFI